MQNKFRLKSIYKVLRNKYLNLKISSKITIYFSVLFIISTLAITFAYKKINSTYMTEKIEQSSFEALERAQLNINTIINDVSNTSKMIISSSEIQDNLQYSNEHGSLEIQNNINKYLMQFTNFNPNIASIYIFDNYGNRYYSENVIYKNFDINDIKNKYWYKQIIDKQGGYIIRLNGGGLFHSKEGNYVSLIRVINDINTQKKIGILIINISEEAFYNSIVRIGDKYGTNLIIKNENGEVITKSKMDERILIEAERQNAFENDKGFSIRKIDESDYIISNMKTDTYGWNLITISEYSQLSKQAQYMKSFILFFISIVFMLIACGSIIISRLITRPLIKLHESMMGVEYGEFKPVNAPTYNDEVGELKKVYNIMIFQIKTLLDKIREDEKFKRKAELEILMSQVKPHFLYNTFDTISSLALLGENRKVYDVVKALGVFYRTSLSNGKDIVTVEEEIKTVKSYLMIQSIRYKDKFEVKYDLDPNCNHFMIIKLILQPLVENALYHGIRNKAGKGLIKISTFEEGDMLVLSVEDDGLGMDEMQLKKVMEGKTPGIGVRATKERVRIFYGEKSEFIVKSEKDEGTKITIKIPKKVGEVIYE